MFASVITRHLLALVIGAMLPPSPNMILRWITRASIFLGLGVLPLTLHAQSAPRGESGSLQVPVSDGGAEKIGPTRDAVGLTPTQAPVTVINRRIYHIYPDKWSEAVELAKGMQADTKKQFGRDFRILAPKYGYQMHVLVFELDYASEEEIESFAKIWYPMLFQKNYVDRFFKTVQHATSELWRFP